MTLTEVAALAGTTLPALAQGEMPHIRGVAALEDAEVGDLSFFGNRKYLPALRRTKATAVFVPLDFVEELPVHLLPVENPSLAFAQVAEKFTPAAVRFAPGRHPTAVVAESAEIHPTASLQPYAVVGERARIGAGTVVGAHSFIGQDCAVGEDCLLHPHVTLREGCVLGRRVIIQSGAVIGGDGFGYEQTGGQHLKIPQVGIVQLDDDVEIGACATIDRARFGRTWIQHGTKVDNLVQIAHNVVIGPHCLIIAQTGISGSAKLGRYVILAGQVGVVGHVEVGDHVVVAAKSGVSKSTRAHERLLGMIGMPIAQEKELMVQYRRLPKTVERVKVLEAEVASLRAAVAALTGAATA